MIQGLPSSVMGWLAARMVAGWLAIVEFTLLFKDFRALFGFAWIYAAVVGISMIRGLGCQAACGGLRCPVAPCGALWRTTAGPYTIPCSVLGAGRMVAGWKVGLLVGFCVFAFGTHCSSAPKRARRMPVLITRYNLDLQIGASCKSRSPNRCNYKRAPG